MLLNITLISPIPLALILLVVLPHLIEVLVGFIKLNNILSLQTCTVAPESNTQVVVLVSLVFKIVGLGVVVTKLLSSFISSILLIGFLFLLLGRFSFKCGYFIQHLFSECPFLLQCLQGLLVLLLVFKDISISLLLVLLGTVLLGFFTALIRLDSSIS